MKKILAFFLPVWVAVLLTGCGNGTDSPEYVAEKFVTHFYKSEYKEAKELATGEALSLIKGIESIAGDDKVEPTKSDFAVEDMTCTVKGDSARCTFTIDNVGGEINLIVEDGVWKASSLPKEVPGNAKNAASDQESNDVEDKEETDVPGERK